MLSKFKRNKHQQHLAQLPKIPQSAADFHTLFSPADFRQVLLEKIASATRRICIVALYLENDEGVALSFQRFMPLNNVDRRWTFVCWSTGIVLNVAVSVPLRVPLTPTGIVKWPASILMLAFPLRYSGKYARSAGSFAFKRLSY